jgi:hypothetical protein
MCRLEDQDLVLQATAHASLPAFKWPADDLVDTCNLLVNLLLIAVRTRDLSCQHQHDPVDPPTDCSGLITEPVMFAYVRSLQPQQAPVHGERQMIRRAAPVGMAPGWTGENWRPRLAPFVAAMVPHQHGDSTSDVTSCDQIACTNQCQGIVYV